VVGHLVEEGPLAGMTLLWWALLLGADLGGNATAIGASANVVLTGITKRNGHPAPSGSSPAMGPSSHSPIAASRPPTC